MVNRSLRDELRSRKNKDLAGMYQGIAAAASSSRTSMRSGLQVNVDLFPARTRG